MSKLNLGLHILAIYVVFIAHQIHGGGLHPTNQKAWYAHASPSKNSNDIVYFATHSTHPGSYYGLAVTMDVYGHNISAGHIVTSIWIANMEGDPKTDENAIWVGWQVDPKKYGDSHTHFFTSWTRDTYHTGCYDMDCPGFQLVKGSKIAPGGTIQPVSHVHGVRQKITIKVFREKSTGNWWIHYGFNKAPTPVGYYPAKLFDKLSKKATQISIGSVVGGSPSIPSPPMGSGFLPSDKAALITDISLIGEDGRMTPFTVNTDRLQSKSSCYSISPIQGAKCSYGGPGGCSR
ncbi:protein neprosin-like [Aegilops tauschii subsp. strangulata]|nr:uncharacterized protein LOC109762424 [Aegilops tauschii subsp. strangulata]